MQTADAHGDAAETAPEAAPEAVAEVAAEAATEPATDTAPETAPETAAEEDLSPRAKAAREAAKYRTRLRETEEALAATTARLEALQLEVAREVAVRAGLVDGREFDRPVSEFVTDDGLVDTSKVVAAVQELLKARPYLSSQKAMPPTLPVPGNGGDPDLGSGASWSRLLGG